MLPNATYAYVGAFVDELARCGVRHVCICPGSRSTPLAVTFGRDRRFRLWMHLDERSAAFFALGLARKTARPVALVCTSGTAAANFMPAVVEARLAQAPLLVLTADRPPELRDVGAPQTIDQIRFYGAQVKWSVEMATPAASADLLRYARTTACRAVATAAAAPAGPVHLNFPLREPLTPVAIPGEALDDLPADALFGRPDGQPYARMTAPDAAHGPGANSARAAWPGNATAVLPGAAGATPAPATIGATVGQIGGGATIGAAVGQIGSNENAAPRDPQPDSSGIHPSIRIHPEAVFMPDLPGATGVTFTHEDSGPWDQHPDVSGVDAAVRMYPEVAFVPAFPALAARLAHTRRGLIVAGPLRVPALAGALAQLADQLGYPILADPLSGLRAGPHDQARICARYDAFLRDERFVEAMAPEVVLRFGAIPTSKPVLQYLQRYPLAEQILVARGTWPDPSLLTAQVIEGDPLALCHALSAHLDAHRPAPAGGTGDAGDGAWLQTWLEADRRAGEALTVTLESTEELFEGRVFAELAALLPAGATLFAGNSMPVRDLDSFFPATARAIDILANRGANGIDGVVSTALGAAAAGAGPAVLAIGDISLYHDMNGLLAARQHRLDLTIVLLNNDGGGIFSFLPQATAPLAGDQHDGDTSGHHALFETLFGTSHGLDFRHVAALYGATYTRVADWAGFRAAVQAGITQGGLHLVEVPTERARNVTLHRRCWPAVAEAIRPILPAPSTAQPH